MVQFMMTTVVWYKRLISVFSYLFICNRSVRQRNQLLGAAAAVAVCCFFMKMTSLRPPQVIQKQTYRHTLTHSLAHSHPKTTCGLEINDNNDDKEKLHQTKTKTKFYRNECVCVCTVYACVFFVCLLYIFSLRLPFETLILKNEGRAK